MIICLNCQGEVVREEGFRYSCKACRHQVLIEDGIVFFHPEERVSNCGMEASILDDAVKFEKRHFWMSARRVYLGRVFHRYVKTADAILEIGVGTGYVARHLISLGYQNYSLGDIHKRGLELSGQSSCQNRYQFNLLKRVFVEHFDVVGMFDVLEHITDDDQAVRNINKMLKKKGRVIITVPAHMWLWSRQDSIASHRKRYEVAELNELFSRNGFHILESKGFFLSMIPFMYLRKIIDRDTGMIKKEDYKGRFKVNVFLNVFLEMLLRLETMILQHCSGRYGGSIVLIAEKSNNLE